MFGEWSAILWLEWLPKQEQICATFTFSCFCGRLRHSTLQNSKLFQTSKRMEHMQTLCLKYKMRAPTSSKWAYNSINGLLKGLHLVFFHPYKRSYFILLITFIAGFCAHFIEVSRHSVLWFLSPGARRFIWMFHYPGSEGLGKSKKKHIPNLPRVCRSICPFWGG